MIRDGLRSTMVRRRAATRCRTLNSAVTPAAQKKLTPLRSLTGFSPIRTRPSRATGREFRVQEVTVVSPKEAFGLLRQASQHRNRKLRDVAAEIIKQISGEDPPPAPEFATPRPRS